MMNDLEGLHTVQMVRVVAGFQEARFSFSLQTLLGGEPLTGMGKLTPE